MPSCQPGEMPVPWPWWLQLLCILSSVAVLPGRASELKVATQTGWVRGLSLPVLDGHVSAFLGVPFAEPPVGRMRFLRPEPVKPWQHVLDATSYQHACYQMVDDSYPGFQGTEMWNPNRGISEDCLYLISGCPPHAPGMSPSWSGSTEGASTVNIIALVSSAKVGAFGPSGESRGAGEHGAAGPALGPAVDPEQHPAFWGQSEGSHHLWGERRGRLGGHAPAFHPEPHPLPAGHSAERAPQRHTITPAGRLLGKQLGCHFNNDSELVSCLRSKTPQELIAKEWSVLPYKSIFRFPFVPVIDGDFFPDTPEAMLGSGNFKETQLLLGVVKDEGSYFLIYGLPGFSKDNESLINQADFLEGVRMGVPHANDIATEAVVLQYTDWQDQDNGEKNREALDDIVGDHNVICPVVQFANDYTKRNNKVYAYLFDHRASNLPWPPWMGVPHGYEIEFVFGLPLNDSLNYTPQEKELSRRMMRYWVNFARTGNPTDPADKNGAWPTYTASRPQYVQLNTQPLATHHSLRAQICAFWNHFLPKLLNATDNIEEAERQWKLEFHLWSAYMMHWKSQFDHYNKQDRCSEL
ncbi:hypothetical protein E2320_023018 [Naja naja]|nr:hypothetical protein E2320_023018 [Naja naja]